MRVLGIAGSPRRGGNTDRLLAEVLRGAVSKGAAVKTIVVCRLNIAPCQHCDACLKTGKCKVMDDMQAVYDEMAQADRVVLASPVHFMGVTAQAKAMIDRCQCLWVKKYVLKLPPLGAEKGSKKGMFVSVGGRNKDGMFVPAIAEARSFFAVLDIAYLGELVFSGVDEKGKIDRNTDAIRRAFLAGQELAED